MAGMFPTMVGDPHDPNRRESARAALTGRSENTDGTWPTALRTAFWLILAAALIMLVTAMMMFSTGFPEGTQEEIRAAFMRNMRVVAIGNIVFALGLATAASLFEKGIKGARPVASACSAAAIFINITAFVFRIGSWASFVIVVLLAFGVFFMFRPAANRFMDEKNSPWHEVD